MKTSTQVARIARALEARGQPSHYFHIAHLAGVVPTTAWRWIHGDVEARGPQKEALRVLSELARQASKSDSAGDLFDALTSGDDPESRRGLRGVLRVLGYAWLERAV